jgi:hypothetical protein
MFYMSKKLCALFVLILASAGLHAAPVTRTWGEAHDKDRWRPRVLLISGELTDADARKLGNALADQAIVYQLQPSSADAAEALRQLEEAKAGDWELAYVDCKGDEISARALATRLHEITKIAVWRNPQSMPLLTATLKELDGVFTADYTVISDQNRDGIIPDYPVKKTLTGSLVGILRTALLAKSPPWASSSQSSRNFSQLANQQDALEDPTALPRAKGKRSTVYRAKKGEWQFNMHPFITRHEGLFWGSSGFLVAEG